MYLRKGQLPIFVINIISILIFIILFLSRKNYEFMLYVGVIVFFLVLIVYTNKKINYPNPILWGLTLWSILHMSGGGIIVNGAILYKLMIYPIIGEPYNIFKYDQLVHMIGFGVATLVFYYLLKPLLKVKKWIQLFIILIMAGLGAGALNEIIEFIATVLVPETNVGGYFNTSLDLIFNLIGAILAMTFIYYKER